MAAKSEEINQRDMEILSKNIGKKYRQFGRKLELTEGEIDNIEMRYHIDEYGEVIIQMAIKWHRKLGSRATFHKLVDILREMDEGSIAEMILKNHGVDSCDKISEKVGNDEANTPEFPYEWWEGEDINDNPECHNCSLTSLGGYYHLPVSTLKEMGKEKESYELPVKISRIVAKYKECGVEINVEKKVDLNAVKDYLLKRMNTGEKLKVVFGFEQTGTNPGHLVVLHAFKKTADTILYRTIDFQRPIYGDPLRITENQLPPSARAPFTIFENKYDVYYPRKT